MTTMGVLGVRRQREEEDALDEELAGDAWSALVNECAVRLKKEKRDLDGVSSALGGLWDRSAVEESNPEAPASSKGHKPAGGMQRQNSLPKALPKTSSGQGHAAAKVSAHGHHHGIPMHHMKVLNADQDSPYMPSSPLRSNSLLSQEQQHSEQHLAHGEVQKPELAAALHHSPKLNNAGLHARSHMLDMPVGGMDGPTGGPALPAISRHQAKPLIQGGPCENPYCGVSEAPQWRRIEKRLVCNRCGMYHHRHGRFPDATYFVLMNNKRQFHTQSMMAAAQLLERSQKEGRTTSSGGSPPEPSSPTRADSQPPESQQDTASAARAAPAPMPLLGGRLLATMAAAAATRTTTQPAPQSQQQQQPQQAATAQAQQAASGSSQRPAGVKPPSVTTAQNSPAPQSVILFDNYGRPVEMTVGQAGRAVVTQAPQQQSQAAAQQQQQQQQQAGLLEYAAAAAAASRPAGGQGAGLLMADLARRVQQGQAPGQQGQQTGQQAKQQQQAGAGASAGNAATATTSTIPLSSLSGLQQQLLAMAAAQAQAQAQAQQAAALQMLPAGLLQLLQQQAAAAAAAAGGAGQGSAAGATAQPGAQNGTVNITINGLGGLGLTAKPGGGGYTLTTAF